jgi:predicted ATPase
MIGQAGLGKSRLKREFKAHLGERVSWLEGTGFGHTQQTAYSVFIAVMKAYLDIHENDSDEEITEKLIFKVKNLFRYPPARGGARDVAHESPPWTGGGAEEDLSEEIIPYIGNQLLSLRFEGERADKVRYLDADGRRRRTFAAVKDLLVAESKRRPVVLALDDLHWIDPLSLELIFFLMETVIDQPILLFCLYRPERTDPCWTIGEQAAIRIPKDFTQIPLSHLSPEASRELLERLLILEGAEELKQQILEKVGGNPFYMEEVLRSLIDDKVIEKVKPDAPNDSRWVVKGDVQEINVPDSLEQVMGARIDKLPDEPKAVLQRGAVIGRTFEVDILQEITPSPRPTPGPSRGPEWEKGQRVRADLENHLSRLTAMDMINLKKPPTDPPEYIFEHIITHDIAYKSIPGVRRRRLHTQVGNCMETKHREHLERMYEQLAQHYHHGSDATKAAIYLARAGKKAKSQYNNRVALTFYQQGLAHLKQLREDLPEERIGMHEGSGDVYTIFGEFDAAIENYTEALRSVRAPGHRAALKRKVANVHEKRAEYDVAMETLNTALEEMKIQPDPVEEARIYNAIGSIHYKKGDFAVAIEITTRALKLVEDTTDHDVIAAIDKNLGNYYLRTRNAERGKEYYLKAIERAGQIGDKILIAQLYNNLGVAGEIMGQMDSALENHQKSLELNEQLGYAAGRTTSYLNLGMVYSKLEDFDRALEYYGKALTIAQRTGAQERVAHLQSNIGAVYCKQRDYDRATEHNIASLEIRERIGDALGVAHCYINLVDASLGKNDIEAAEMYAITGLGTAVQVDVPQVIAGAYNSIGTVEKRKGAWGLAMGYFQEAAEIAEGTGAKQQLAEAYRNIGEVYLEVKNIEGAKASFQKAIALYEQLRVRSEVEKIKGFLQKCER